MTTALPVREAAKLTTTQYILRAMLDEDDVISHEMLVSAMELVGVPESSMASALSKLRVDGIVETSGRSSDGDQQHRLLNPGWAMGKGLDPNLPAPIRARSSTEAERQRHVMDLRAGMGGIPSPGSVRIAMAPARPDIAQREEYATGRKIDPSTVEHVPVVSDRAVSPKLIGRLSALIQRGGKQGVPRGSLSDAVKCFASAAHVDAALDAMRLEHKITGELVKTKGRPSKVWRWNFVRFPVAGVVETNETTPEPAQAVEIAPPAELPPAVAERSHEALNDLVEATIRIGNYEAASEFAARLPDAERRAMQRRIAGLVDAEIAAAREILYDAGRPAPAADAPQAPPPSESRTSKPDAVETGRGPVVAKDDRVILRPAQAEFGVNEKGELALIGKAECMVLSPQAWAQLAKVLAALAPVFGVRE